MMQPDGAGFTNAMATESLTYLPTHVAICQDCGCIAYGSIFVKAIKCPVCKGRNKLACRLREDHE